MDEQFELYVKFTRNGAKQILQKIKEEFKIYYQKNEKGKKYKEVSEPADWKEIEKYLYDKGFKSARKLLYEEIYLFQTHGASKNHSGDVKLEDLMPLFEGFLPKERVELYRIEQTVEKSEDGAIEFPYGLYGTLIKKGKQVAEESEPHSKYMSFTKLPEEATYATWSLYSFWEENELNDKKETTGGKKYRILQSLVKFEADKITLHYTNKFGIIEEFSGEIHAFDYHGQIYFETDLMQLSDERAVRIMFLFGEKMADLAMTIFYNIRSEGALFSGSGLLVKETETSKAIIENSKAILHQSVDNQTINHFFERRSQNYLKLPRITDYSLKGLQGKLNILLSKGVPKDIRISKHDFFVSIPMAYILDSKAEFMKNKKFCQDTIAILTEEFKLKKNYFACEKYNFKDYKQMPKGTHYENSMEGIAESKLFVLVIPEMQLPSKNSTVRFSSIWTELGYAIGIKKPILIICDINFRAKLPNIVESLINKQIMVITPDMRDIKKMESWFQISSNKLDIEKFLREKFIS